VLLLPPPPVLPLPLPVAMLPMTRLKLHGVVLRRMMMYSCLPHLPHQKSTFGWMHLVKSNHNCRTLQQISYTVHKY
jgi:hypothetical protein